MRQTTARRLALALAALSLLTTPAAGQGLTTLSAHWGALMLPDLQDRREITAHFVNFTRFGKELRRDPAQGLPRLDFWQKQYTFTPYNDMPETLGFNLVSYSSMDTRWRGIGVHRPTSVNTSPYARRRTYSIGIINDHITQFLQNQVIHQGRFNKEGLDLIPRDSLVDTPAHASYGPSRHWPPLASFGEEFFLRLSYLARENDVEERVYTPLFIGGGYVLSTINHDVFVHLGSNVTEFVLPGVSLLGVQLRAIGVGGMLRAGVPRPSIHLDDIASSYASAQSLVRGRFEFGGFPVSLEYGLTASTGLFVASRSESQKRLIEERGDNQKEVYVAKTALPERFRSIRLRIGEFTFETYNDSPGGKDKGPSFGASASYNVYSPRPNRGRP